MATTSEDGGIHAATTRKGGAIAIHLDVYMLVLSRIVVQRAVGYGLDIDWLRLAQPRHVGQHKLVGMNLVERRRVLGYHCPIHLLVEGFNLLFVVHLLILWKSCTLRDATFI